MGQNISENVIVIEGHSGVGKTSTAQTLAVELGYAFLDSGLVYRAFSLHLIRHDIPLVPKLVYRALDSFDPYIKKDGSVILEGHDVTSLLHDRQVTEIVSSVSSAQFVRKKVNKIMLDFSSRYEGQVVITGRSTAAEVFPETRLIFDLQADAEVRAMRRFTQRMETWNGEGMEPNYDEILVALRKRDLSDINKPVMPMATNEQAVIINTEELDLKEVVDQISKEVRLKIATIEGVMRRNKEL
ncbi:MAG: (d)CMP kinase [Candidatus Pacebacteria bacterium]|nr:(d)CMP kinase [Candidatus Paceibacterota bacterium]